MPNDIAWMAVEGGVVYKPSLKHTGRGTAVCKFGLLCTAKKKWYQDKDKESMYFTVTTIGRTAETIYPRLKIGMPVRAEGEYSDAIYRDKLTDEPRIGRFIFADRVRVFIFWQYRSVGKKKQDEADRINAMKIASNIDLESLPF